MIKDAIKQVLRADIAERALASVASNELRQTRTMTADMAA
jgi:hypothetical protein